MNQNHCWAFLQNHWKSIFDYSSFIYVKYGDLVNRLPLATTLRRLFLAVVQFHLRLPNWCWHSLFPSWAPLTISCKTSGSLRHISALRPLCTRRWLWRHKRIGSITAWPTLALPTHIHPHKSVIYCSTIPSALNSIKTNQASIKSWQLRSCHL